MDASLQEEYGNTRLSTAQHHRYPFHSVRIFTPPFLRVKFGHHEEQHPVVDWGELFYDLFFVAAAYNLGVIIKSSLDARGFLYFCGTCWPIMLLWFDKLYYDSRFFIGDDLYHRVFKMVNYVSLATAVQHISPDSIMSNSSGNAAMFGFSVALVFCNTLTVVRYLEIWLNLTDSPAAQAVAKRNMLYKVLPTSLYLAATILSGTAHFGSSPDDAITDVPIGLCIAAVIVDKLSTLYTVVMKSKGRITDDVGINIAYVIHRIGEWTILIMGEAILSLLIVEVVATWDFYLTFYAGVISVILLEYLHFRSQPHHVDEHAMRRSVLKSYVFTLLMQCYSAALILLGVSYKMLLTEYVLGNDDRGDETPSQYGSATGLSSEVRRQRLARLFGLSMASVWACSDAMMLMHADWRHNLKRTRKSFVGTMLVAIRVGLIAFCASLSQWQDSDPESIALFGLVACTAQVVLRIATSVVFPDERVSEIIRRESQVLIDNSAALEVAATAAATGDQNDVENQLTWADAPEEPSR